VQTDILDRGPDNHQAAGLSREHVNLVGALSHIGKETFDGVRRLNVTMHHLRKRIKRQQMLFVLSQTAHRFWIALSILGFEGSQLGQCLRLGRLLPDTNQFGLDIAALSSGDSREHIALFMHQAALARGGRKQFPDGSEQSIMPVGDDEIDLGCPTSAQILQEAEPSLLAFLSAR